MGRQLLAMWLLGWSLLEVLLGRLVAPKAGVAQFRAHYRPDRLEPISEDDRAVMLGASRCIGCGRCSLAAARSAGPGAWFVAPSQAVIAAARSLPEYDLAAEAFGGASPAQLEACERDCPAGVPFVALGRAVRRHALALPSRV